MWTYSWSGLRCDGIFFHRHLNVKSLPEGMDVSIKMCAFVVVNLLTVLCIDSSISTGRDSRVPGRSGANSGKHIQLVSAYFKGHRKLSLTWSTWSSVNMMFIMMCGGGFWRYQRGCRLMKPLKISALDKNLRLNNELTVVTDDERCNGRRQLLSSNCTFIIESISICDSGTLIVVTKVALVYMKVAVDQDDSSGVSNSE